MGVFGDLFSGSKAAEPHYAAAAGRQAGLEQATGTLNTGYDKASQYLDTASKRFDPLANTANQGFQGYANLFGIGGGDPTAAVRNMPGYQFSQDQGQEAAMRNAAAMGQLSSGNAMQSVFNTGANIADTKWQEYAKGLLPFLQLAPQIAGQQGGYNVAQAGLESGLANTLAQYQTGTANANSQEMINAQQARAGASKNAFDAVMGGVKLAASAATGMPMGGGSGGSGGGFNLANYFNSGNPTSAAYGSNPFGSYGQINPAYA